MNNDHELIFLALIALGTFSVDEKGNIWRQKEQEGGSRMGSPATEKILPEPRRAETGRSHGYLRIQHTYKGVRIRAYAHRIVWMIANKSEIPAGLQINHKNGLRTDNNPSNLELVTSQENSMHAGQILKTLGKKEQKGEKNTSAKLTAEQVLVIRRLWDKKELSQSKIAIRYKVSQQTIHEICSRKTWKHLP